MSKNIIKKRLGYQNLGLGVGLRTVHIPYILKNLPPVDWFEILTENFLDSEGKPKHNLKSIAKHYPIVIHGVSLSIGSTNPIDFKYLQKVKELAKEVNAKWISDHLCWTGILGVNTHDLLPIPYTEEALAHVIGRIKKVQDFLGRPLILENPTRYVSFTNSSMSESEFITRMANQTGCGLLIDLENMFISSSNLNYDPVEFLKSLPHEHIVQFHLAGHTKSETYMVDTHSNSVSDESWELYRVACELTGGASTLLEWDENIPPFPVLHAEILKAKKYMSKSLKNEC